MGRRLVGGLAATGWTLVLAAPLLGQQLPLGEVARKENERRAAIEETSKVYTNDDLRGGARLTTGTAAATRADAQEPGAAASAASPETTPSDAEEPEQGEAYWRGLVTRRLGTRDSGTS